MTADDLTPLDRAQALMLADPEDDGARLRYYRVLSDAELFLLLEEEAVEGNIRPRVFPLDSGPVVLAFDSQERMVDFTGIASPYVALPGRVIVNHLTGQGTGLGINLGTPEAAWLMAPHAVDWLAEVLSVTPSQDRGRPAGFAAPGELPRALNEALAVAIGGAGGLAAGAWLARARWKGGSEEGLVLAYVGAEPGAEEALARALTSALAFSGLEDEQVDLLFLNASDTAALRPLQEVGLALRLPEPPAPEPERAPPPPPGMDPTKPPKLR
ncbi:SseB family protein [Falsigemmobacter intermedius]|uniref:SseB family protein n=1 Tax=Falsigemmobacter intermedius TaxID=1553448 RepID=A0A3S3U8Z7_9RHOB|nr:SseB family protein [Falsigemmobacter intermedius]RWY41732.1 SseB family protein [Falsigemmobacter intermedius]